MKRFFGLLLLAGLFLGVSADNLKTLRVKKDCSSAVTYGFSGGRFGDCLIAYMHAKWVSYIFRVPLLYKSFEYSNKLALSLEKQPLHSQRNYRNKAELSKKNVLPSSLNANTLYTIPFFPESRYGATRPHNRFMFFNFFVDWEDENFIKILRSAIQPIKPLDLVYPPEGKISIAMHVRRGGGFDGPLACELGDDDRQDKTVGYADVNVEAKFPPQSYYIEQLRVLDKLFQGRPLYVHVFTDDQNPQKLVDTYKKELGLSSIEFCYRTGTNKHDLNVLEDFFSLGNFDCLIRGDSNFALVASKIFDYKLVVSPVYAHWEKNTLTIDRVDVRVNDEAFVYNY